MAKPPSESPSESPPKRLSKAWIFGFSDQPFLPIKKQKQPQEPKISNPYRQIIKDPGSLIEWVASDGRKGVVKRSSQALNAENLAKLPADPGANDKKSPSTVARASYKPSGTRMDMSNYHAGELTNKLLALQGKAPIGSPKKDDDTMLNFADFGDMLVSLEDDVAANAQAGFTEAEDKTLLEMKQDNATWAEIAATLGKPKMDLVERFKKIKPVNFRANPQNRGKNGKGKAVQVEANTSGQAGESPASGAANNVGAQRSSPSVVKDSTRSNANTGRGRAPPVQATNTHSPTTMQSFIDVSPDEDFSMDELVLLAKILQEDAANVWKRVASRFRDKTMRDVAPTMLKEKILGKETEFRGDVRDV